MFDQRKEKHCSAQCCIDMEEYSRPLNRPEAKHRYWHIMKADRDFFPDDDVEYRICPHYRFKLALHSAKQIINCALKEVRSVLGGVIK